MPGRCKVPLEADQSAHVNSRIALRQLVYAAKNRNGCCDAAQSIELDLLEFLCC
jgi:hypothetical protein